jgi:hydrogenase maturation protease
VLLDRWRGYDSLILMDAVSSVAPRGTVHCWNVHRDNIPFDTFACSTHSFGVAEAIELEKILGIETGSSAMAWHNYL